MKLRCGILYMALLATTLLAACDSGDPIDEPEPRDVSGRYDFAQFVFQPTSTQVRAINILDTLVVRETHLDLSSDATFTLRYEIEGGGFYSLFGSFSVTARAVRLDGQSEQKASFNRILLDEDFRLHRSETESGVLTAEIPKSIDPRSFPGYEGIELMSGTLRIRLVKQ